MPTNRKRTLRRSKNRIPGYVTQEYLESLRCRDFLADCTNDIYNDALNEDEAALLREYEKCERDFEKWQKMKRGNIHADQQKTKGQANCQIFDA